MLEKFDPRGSMYKKGAHFPSIAFIGNQKATRRSPESQVTRTATARNRGWTRDKIFKHKMLFKGGKGGGAKGGKGIGRDNTDEYRTGRSHHGCGDDGTDGTYKGRSHRGDYGGHNDWPGPGGESWKGRVVSSWDDGQWNDWKPQEWTWKDWSDQQEHDTVRGPIFCKEGKWLWHVYG